MDNIDIDELKQRLEQFSAKRGWLSVDSPKNLSMAIATEAGELLDIFQWLTEEQSYGLDPEQRQQVADEMADVLTNIIRMAGVLDINLSQALSEKLDKNAKKYPLSVKQP